MAETYTPTVEDACWYYVEGRLSIHDGFEAADEAQFYRMIASVRSDTLREVAEEILAAERRYSSELASWLRARAAEIRER